VLRRNESFFRIHQLENGRVTVLSSDALPRFLLGQYDVPMSFSETIFLFFLALVIFGPKKLPEIARQVGKYLNEFRRASNEFKAQIEQEIAHLEVENKQTILPPSPPVAGTTSRTLEAAQTEVTYAEAAKTEAPAPSSEATLAAPSEEVSPTNGSAPIATEAAHPDDAVTTPASQESHA
jgi:sec-independent protein translocase protein TatB